MGLISRCNLDTMGRNFQKNCKGCGKAVLWIQGKSGKWIPCDPTPKLTVVLEDGEVVSGFQSHFATCPQANQFRRERKEKK